MVVVVIMIALAMAWIWALVVVIIALIAPTFLPSVAIRRVIAMIRPAMMMVMVLSKGRGGGKQQACERKGNEEGFC